MRSASDTLTDRLTDDVAPSPPGGERRRLVAVILLVLLVGGLITSLIFAFGGGDKRATSLPGRPTVLDAAARDLVSLMSKGQEGVYHARYRATSPEQPGVTLTIEIWRKGGLTRQDSVASDGTRTIHTAGFTLPSGTVACRREAAGPWSCVPVTGVRTTTDQFSELAAIELSGRTVTARDESIAGRPARCFTIVGEGQSSDICLSSQGVALRVASGAMRMELIDIEGVADDAVFRPPAATG